MSMNIKNDETHRLARELADATGESLTAAVTVAVRERLERVRTNPVSEGERRLRKDALMSIAQEAAALDPGLRSADIDHQLYDESGLPR